MAIGYEDALQDFKLGVSYYLKNRIEARKDIKNYARFIEEVNFTPKFLSQ